MNSAPDKSRQSTVGRIGDRLVGIGFALAAVGVVAASVERSSTKGEKRPTKSVKAATTSERRKHAGRVVNGVLSLVLVGVAAYVSVTSINTSADAGVPLTGYGAAAGLAIATATVGFVRALVSIAPSGRRRIWLWALALIGSGLYSYLFVEIGGVKWTSFLLILAVFVPPIVQDFIEG